MPNDGTNASGPDKYRYLPESAETYSKLGIEGTSYEMAFAETGRLLGNLSGKTYLDFGCGTGRSARFLKALGATKVIGVDCNQTMVDQAKAAGGEGLEFLFIGETLPLPDSSLDGALASASFVEVKTLELMQQSMREISRVLKTGAPFVLTTTNPQAFGHDFKNFSIEGDPAHLRSGDIVKCTIKGDNPFIIDDVFWTEADYRAALVSSGFGIESIGFPKAPSGQGWIDETRVAPTMVMGCRKT